MNRRPLRLLHVFSTFAAGGPQIRFVAIANALGPAVYHAVLPMDGRTDAAHQIHSTVPFKLLQPPAQRRSSLQVVQFFRSMVQDRHPDLVLTYNWGAIEATLGARIASAPVIHAEDGFGPEETASLKVRRILTRRIILNRIHKTVVPSRTLQRIALGSYRLRPDKVQLIPNGVDTERFRTIRSSLTRERLGIEADALLFGYVGHLRAEKNLGLLLQAFASANVRQSRLIIVGDGPCRPELERIAREFGLSSRVLFVGSTTNPESYLAAMDVFTMSSLTEQMPIALLEAMACGLPAICTDVGDTAEILGDFGPGEVVKANDLPGFAKALRRAAQDAEWRHTVGIRNRQRCAACYSFERMLDRYVDLYEAAVAS